VIVAPTTDQACLGQLTQMARELAPTTLIQTVAARLGSPSRVVAWIRSLPQTDDDGHELYRYISCDVSQRVRLLPDDPNCFERSFAALMLLEAVDPTTHRMLVTIERPLRHTGLVEWRSGRWVAVDLFPRRNVDWGETGKDILQGVHSYVGKPVLGFYGLGGQADTLGEYEDKAIGRDKKKEKKEHPPSQSKPAQPAQAAKPAAKPAQPQQAQRGPVRPVLKVVGAGAKQTDTTPRKGGENAEVETKQGQPAAGEECAGGGCPAPEGEDPDGGDGRSYDPSDETKRWGWG